MGVDSTLRRAVFLDRDGVINRSIIRDGKPYPPATIDEVEILPDVEQALSKLREAGYILIVVTNQPDVARGTQTRGVVENIHDLLASRLPLDDFRACYHDDSDSCSCRKPKPGMILEAARDHRVDLSASVMVGDRWRDIEAGQRAGCATVFVDRGYEEKRPAGPDAVVSSLGTAAGWILKRDRTMTRENS